MVNSIHYQIREEVIQDVQAYITYYNSCKLHTSLGKVAPQEFEKNA
ncbi:IS3 family transposase [Nitrosomonas europaea]